MVMNHYDSAFNSHPNPARGCAESVNWNLKGAVLLVVMYRLPIVAQGEVGEAQEEGRHHLEGKILAGHGNGESTLSGLNGASLVTRGAEVVAQIGGDPAQSAVIVQGRGEPFGFAQVFKYRLKCSERNERIAHVEPQINGLLAPFLTLWKMPCGNQRLLEACHRLPESRARKRLCPGLPVVGPGLVPHLAPERMAGQPFHLLGQPVGIQCLDGRHDPRVERPPPLLEQAAVGYLVG